MAFLDNSGDIILDAVLTDTGRQRLARGDGSFRIAKFALADDEVDYAKYDKLGATGRKDLEILQTPVLEAFTNNTSTMKNMLLSIPRTNLLYLPVMMLNEHGASQDAFRGGLVRNAHASNGSTIKNRFVVSSDQDTQTAFTDANMAGHIQGVDTNNTTTLVKIDQGLHTEEISYAIPLPSDLTETQYIVEIDNRLGVISNGNIVASMSFVDDDNIASYYFSLVNDASHVTVINATNTQGNQDQAGAGSAMVLNGPRGTCFKFHIKPSLDLQTSTFLFTKFGTSDNTLTGTDAAAAGTYRLIDSTIRITGATTGYTIDIPVTFAKKQ